MKTPKKIIKKLERNKLVTIERNNELLSKILIHITKNKCAFSFDIIQFSDFIILKIKS